MPAPTGSWFSFFLGAGCGCLAASVVVGGALLAFGWLLLTELDKPKDPLTSLGVTKERLSFEEAKSSLDQMANDYLADPNNVGLVIGVWKDGRQQVFGYGVRAKNTRQPPDADTVFELASVGKTLTTTVLTHMHLRGELDLNDPVQKFLPEGVKLPSHEARPITLLDLATHTSALPNMPPNFNSHVVDPENPYKDYTQKDLYTDLSKITLTVPPGQRYEYSNLAMGLLGDVLQRHAGASYEELVLERVCRPLGMHSTRITLDETMKARLAQPHAQGRAVPVWEDYTLQGAGSFLSTADDMLLYLAAHLAAPPAEAADLTLFQALRLGLQKRRPADSRTTAMGLGWHITSENATDVIWHNGASGGSVSFVGMMETSRSAVVVLSNSTSSVDDLGVKALHLLHRADMP
jgi:CubicO group peptidase (beta-lactamase class C family)